MKLLPIRYTGDVEAATRFYTALGLQLDVASRPGSWVELAGSAGTLALHRRDGDEPACELAFEADEPLETIVDRLRAAGHDPGPILDEGFGRSFRVRDPDGVRVQVNDQDRELYT